MVHVEVSNETSVALKLARLHMEYEYSQRKQETRNYTLNDVVRAALVAYNETRIRNGTYCEDKKWYILK